MNRRKALGQDIDIPKRRWKRQEKIGGIWPPAFVTKEHHWGFFVGGGGREGSSSRISRKDGGEFVRKIASAGDPAVNISIRISASGTRNTVDTMAERRSFGQIP